VITRILLAVDGSEPSGRALPFAGEIARRFGAEIVVFHALEHVSGHGGGEDAEVRLVEAAHLTDRAVRWLKDEGVSARGETRGCYVGHVPLEVLRAAREEAADLIVMGSRGLSALRGLLLGSVAHKVLQLSEVPVLIVR
jgi:nucleotide-binding universal stress UspA family protein